MYCSFCGTIYSHATVTGSKITQGAVLFPNTKIVRLCKNILKNKITHLLYKKRQIHIMFIFIKLCKIILLTIIYQKFTNSI